MKNIDRDRVVPWALAATVVAIALWLSLGRDAASDPPGGQVALDGTGASPAAVQAEGAHGRRERIQVHVVGAVRRPGVYRLPAGARAGDALSRAGGTTGRADPAGVNLAARLTDGQQVVVPRRSAAAAAAGPATTAPGGSTAGSGAGTAAAAPGGAAPLSLATATVEQLDALDGIGPTLARRIVEYRDRNGGFRSVDELGDVEGIGEVRLAALREAVVL